MEVAVAAAIERSNGEHGPLTRDAPSVRAVHRAAIGHFHDVKTRCCRLRIGARLVRQPRARNHPARAVEWACGEPLDRQPPPFDKPGRLQHADELGDRLECGRMPRGASEQRCAKVRRREVVCPALSPKVVDGRTWWRAVAHELRLLAADSGRKKRSASSGRYARWGDSSSRACIALTYVGPDAAVVP